MPLDAVLGTVNPDGSPHTVPVGYLFDGRRFLVASGSTTRKVRNVETNPRVRLIVMAPATSTDLGDRWVAATGSAQVVSEAEAQRLNALVLSRYLTEEGKRGFEKTFLPLLDVTIVMIPDRWQTWTEAGMLETAAEHGFTEADVADWYVAR